MIAKIYASVHVRTSLWQQREVAELGVAVSRATLITPGSVKVITKISATQWAMKDNKVCTHECSRRPNTRHLRTG
jgi:hypothetical protein